jgi:hypothetical protein
MTTGQAQYCIISIGGLRFPVNINLKFCRRGVLFLNSTATIQSSTQAIFALFASLIKKNTKCYNFIMKLAHGTLQTSGRVSKTSTGSSPPGPSLFCRSSYNSIMHPLHKSIFYKLRTRASFLLTMQI